MNSAWEELPFNSDKRTLAWDYIYDWLGFKPSISPNDFPGIREPEQSLTYSFSSYFALESEEKAIQMERELNLVLYNVFCQVTPFEEEIYALDWQHTCFSFYPHLFENSEVLDNWKIPILPNGDYYIFIHKDFQFGTFGHPWEQTICFYGEDFISLVESDLTRILGKPIRRNGKHVND
jgi:hypothetical protein